MCRAEDNGKQDCSRKKTKESRWAQEEEPGFQANTDVVTQRKRKVGAKSKRSIFML